MRTGAICSSCSTFCTHKNSNLTPFPLATAQPEDRFQFERHGFFVADRQEHQAGCRLVFNRIAGLKDSWGK